MRLESVAAGTPHLMERLDQFRAFTMAHPHLVAARDELMDAIDGATPGSLVLVLGPTGVGKTTLRMKVENLLIQQMTPTLAVDPGRLPFVSVEIVPTDTGWFRWRDYYSRLLAATNEPLIDSKLTLDSGAIHKSALTTRDTDLSYAAEMALRHRRPPVVFIDEAQHLARISSGRKLSDQLDVIKSIANRTQTVHVLFGTYELLAFRNLSAQLSRRSMDLHFRRYGTDTKDRQVFQNVLLTFQKQLPFEETGIDLSGMWEFFYERSVGCVGILKEWLMRASVRSIRHGSPTMSREHLEQTALSISQCEKILAESRDGESRLHDDEDSRLRFRTLLGLGPQSRGGIAPAQGAVAFSGNAKRGRVGQRSPRRDPIQGDAVAAYA